MNEVKKCPKCGGEMEIGYLNNAHNWIRGKSLLKLLAGPRIYAFACKNCSYVEFYLEKKVLSHE
jgi:predicted nucleic-acid-binding Zn-ribbon protein